MKKNIGTFFIIIVLISLEGKAQGKASMENALGTLKHDISATIDNWHKAAANANFEAYFSLMTDDAVYIGTDATENWNVDAFKAYSKPHFERGKAWAFSDLERNIYVSEDREIAWFDELLKTHMGICRGSGILVKDQGKWKIKHFVLSMTIPNDRAGKVARLKHGFDKRYVEKITIKEK